VWDLDGKTLLEYGCIKPSFKTSKKKGVTELIYPQLQALKLANFAEELVELISKYDFDTIQAIVIEEINGSKNRLGQKTLDGLHWLLLDRLPRSLLFKVKYCDSDGKTGWRSAQGLALQLSETDKAMNKDRKAFNKKLAKGQKKKPVITQKTLAARFVNSKFGLAFDVDARESDSDICDAIGLGYYIIHHVLQEKVSGL
jgi:hypothetical protein